MRRNIVVIGGSAGALDALLRLAADLPGDFDCSVFVVSHIGANRSQLPDLIAHDARLPASHAEHGEPIRPGHIYVAPPDRHMLISDGHIALTRGPRQHFTRPAIDPLFRSAARVFGPAVIGVVLSGTGSDGTIGLEAIKQAGGVAVVQAVSDALFPEMPSTAAATVAVDHVVSSGELGALLTRLTRESVTLPVIAEERAMPVDPTDFERPTALTCPDCGGALRELAEMPVKTYRCHTGHQFGATELMGEQLEELEHAMVVAVRVLNEHAELCRRMTAEAQRAGRSHGVAYWTRLRDEAEAQLDTLGRYLARERPRPDDDHVGAAATPAK